MSQGTFTYDFFERLVSKYSALNFDKPVSVIRKG